MGGGCGKVGGVVREREWGRGGGGEWGEWGRGGGGCKREGSGGAVS